MMAIPKQAIATNGTADKIAPVAPTDVKPANKEPKATLPINDWIPAAKEPDATPIPVKPAILMPIAVKKVPVAPTIAPVTPMLTASMLNYYIKS